MSEQLITNHEAERTTAELIADLEDRIRQRSLEDGVTHQPVLDEDGKLIATKQSFEVGYTSPVREDQWERRITIDTTTTEQGQAAGHTTYTVIDSKDRDVGRRPSGPITWEAGAEGLSQRFVGPRGWQDIAVSDRRIADMLDIIDGGTIVVDKAAVEHTGFDHEKKRSGRTKLGSWITGKFVRRGDR